MRKKVNMQTQVKHFAEKCIFAAAEQAPGSIRLHSTLCKHFLLTIFEQGSDRALQMKVSLASAEAWF